MDYAKNYASQVASQLGSLSDEPIVAPGELNRLSQRLEGILHGMRAITTDLTCHADRLHGGQALNAGGAEKPRPVRSGALGTLEDLIDMIGEQAETLYTAASRNTGLA